MGKNASVTISIVFQELRCRALNISLALGLMVLSAGITALTPYLFSLLIDKAIPVGDTSLITWLLIGMVVSPVMAQGLVALQNYQHGQIGQEVSRVLRQRSYEHLMRVQVNEFERFKSGEIVQRLTVGCGRIGEVYIGEQLLPLTASAITVIANVVAMAFLNLRLTLVALIAVPMIFVIAEVARRRGLSVVRQGRSILDGAMSYLVEAIAGFRTVRALNGSTREKPRWADWVKQIRDNKIRILVINKFFISLATDFATNMLLAVILGFGAFEIIGGHMGMGELVAFIVYVPRAYNALAVVFRTQMSSAEFKADAEKLDELFAAIPERQTGQPLTIHTSPSIQFDDVTFKYGRGDAGVEDVSFHVKPGEFIGLVGPSGGGKSTIIDLLLGLYTPQCGRILINGVDLCELSLHELRSCIGWVPQEVFLWNNSIRDNLAYPTLPLQQEVEMAVETAQLSDFINSLPQGLDTVVGERGMSISGGERQRLAIARALLRQPGILLLDEATSALDALTELKFRRAFEKAREGRTTIVVAHRLATVMGADRILVLDKGRVVETGAPQELVAQRGMFYDFYQAQKLTVVGG
ncbi:MAG: ABC transporter ATP-binding protein/permease [Chloroflexi bacterium]|nr:ABC transporter ATP-binding protein/permease [Chloroflexota bacterium]MCL5274854.1 ABC transporter ATP-binding protein/permease [Chloroflexota bacterium]